MQWESIRDYQGNRNKKTRLLSMLPYLDMVVIQTKVSFNNKLLAVDLEKAVVLEKIKEKKTAGKSTGCRGRMTTAYSDIQSE